MREFLRTRLVSETEFWQSFAKTGGIYFISDKARDAIKIGFSRDPWTRLSNLQVGNPSTLQIIGLIAAPASVEQQFHFWHLEGRMQGEWFSDRGVLTEWLNRFTEGYPLCRLVCDFVPAQEVIWYWDEETKQHTKHVRSADGSWEPPFK